MAIRIPVITSEPLGVPSIRVGSALGAKLGAAESVQGFVGQVMQDVNEFRQKQKSINQVIELTQVESDIQTENLKNIKALREDPGILENPESYFPNWQASFIKSANERLSKIQDPETRQKAQINIGRMLVAQKSDEFLYGNTLYTKTKMGQVDLILDRFEEQEDLESGIEFLSNPKIAVLYDPVILANKKIAFKNGVQSRIKKNNLKLASGEIETSRGEGAEEIFKKYGIEPEDQVLLRRRVVELEEKQEKNITRAAKDFSEVMTADLTERIRKGEDVGNIISEYAPHNGRLITSEDYEKLLRYTDAKKSAVEEDADPELAREVKIKTNLAVPTMTESQVVALMRSGKIGDKTGEKALDQLRTTGRYWREEGQQEYMKNYSEAQKTIFRGFGMTGLELELIEKIDPAKKRLIDDALRQLYNRTLGSKKKEDPMTVATEILPGYQKGIEGENMLSVETYKKLLGKYKTKQELNTAYESKEIDWNEYKQKLIYMREMENKSNEPVIETKGSKEKFGR